MIEHPRIKGSTLVDSAKPVETTDAVYRFELLVAAGKKEEFTVKEENIDEQEMEIVDTDVANLQTYSRTGEIAAPVREALLKAAALKQAIADTEKQTNDDNRQISALSADQARIRENIKSVDRTSTYASRLLKKLDDQETQIDKLRADADKLRTKLENQSSELEQFLENLNAG